MNSRTVLVTLVLAASVSALQTINDDLRVSKRFTGSLGGSLTVDSSTVLKKRPTSTNLHTIAGWDSVGDTVKQMPIGSLTSDSVTHADHADTADVAFKALLTTHGVTSGTVPKAATDSTFTNSHISENGDTTKIFTPTYAPSVTIYDDAPANTLNSPRIAYGNSTYVVMGWGSSEYRTSIDGISWSDITSWASINTIFTRDLSFSGGIFIVPYQYSNYNRLVTSSDGSSWAEANRTFGGIYDLSLNSSIYGNGTFVVVGGSYIDSGGAISSDGVTWVMPQTVTNDWQSVAFGNGIFVAVSSSGTSDRIMISSDGVSWTKANTFDHYFTKIVFGDGIFVAITGGKLSFVSDDGLTWDSASLPISGASTPNIAYGDGHFVIVDAFSETDMVYSSDGLSWDTFPGIPDGYRWGDICYGDNKFVAVSTNSRYFMNIEFVESASDSVFVVNGKTILKNTPTTTTPAYLLTKNAAPDNEIKSVSMAGVIPGLIADSSRTAGDVYHGVTPLHIAVSKDSTHWKTTGITYDTTSNYVSFPRYILFDSSAIQDIYINTEDGYDNKSLTISPSGQGTYASRGAWSLMTGNEHALNGDWWMSTGEEGAFRFGSAVGAFFEWDGDFDNNDRFSIKPGTGTVQTAVGTDSGPLLIYGDGDAGHGLIIAGANLHLRSDLVIDTTRVTAAPVYAMVKEAFGDTLKSRRIDSLVVDSARAAGKFAVIDNSYTASDSLFFIVGTDTFFAIKK
ncbi:MAG: hypothetical protein PHC68_11600 [Syntrophorhabdaceae bacterium]|nr:hypothetical protein [Syntrophorhabdaceae bacterium]